jgi:diaminohydroxyphosphoribosylaminopyrimidine deaminase/5-amino-6-(5-phosphoribosylamino)uracil reductase
MMQEAGVDVQVGVLEKECLELNKRFVCLHTQHRPYVILKWAQTADGYIDVARDCGVPLIISTPLTKQLVHQQRAENMSIMVGTRTVILDNPRLLNSRWSGRNPIRITLDRHHVLPEDSNIFSDQSPTIVYRDNTEWTYVLSDLAKRNIHSVLVEGGAILLQNIIDSGLYDEVHVEVSQYSLSQSVGRLAQGVEAPKYVFSTQPTIVDGNRIYVEYKNGF